MEFQPPYFPPPFPGTTSVQTGGQDVFSQHLQSADPYQHYAVSALSFYRQNKDPYKTNLYFIL